MSSIINNTGSRGYIIDRAQKLISLRFSLLLLHKGKKSCNIIKMSIRRIIISGVFTRVIEMKYPFPAILLILSLSIEGYSQTTNERYTIIAKDGSQVINALLLKETAESYIVRIGDRNETLVIEKKNIKFLQRIEGKKVVRYKPVRGRKSSVEKEPEKIPGAVKKETDRSKSFYSRNNATIIFSLHTVSDISGSERKLLSGWGTGIISSIDLFSLHFLQGGVGLDYYRLDSSVHEMEISVSMTNYYCHLQLIGYFNPLGAGKLKLSPFIGFNAGGTMAYNFMKPKIDYKIGDEENENRSAIKKFSTGSSFNFRAGIGINFPRVSNVEIVFSVKYLLNNDSFLDNFLSFSLGIGYRF